MIATSRPRERKRRQDREGVEAERLMQIIRMHEGRRPELRMVFHVPNGGARSAKAGAKLKKEGVRPGVPDYLWPMRNAADQCGLAIELKAKGGRVEKEQREWLHHLAMQGWVVVVAYGWKEAWRAICDYAGWQDTITLRRAS